MPAAQTSPQLPTAWDLIGFDGSLTSIGEDLVERFRIPEGAKVRIRGGRALYESVCYEDATARSERVRLSHLVVGADGLRQVNRYVDPETVLEFVGPER